MGMLVCGERRKSKHAEGISFMWHLVTKSSSQANAITQMPHYSDSFWNLLWLVYKDSED